MTNLGKRVQAARLAAGLSQGQLAERAGTAQAAISRIERGETHEPGVFIMAGIARALDTTMDELVSGESRVRRAGHNSAMLARHDRIIADLDRRLTAVERRL